MKTLKKRNSIAVGTVEAYACYCYCSCDCSMPSFEYYYEYDRPAEDYRSVGFYV